MSSASMVLLAQAMAVTESGNRSAQHPESARLRRVEPVQRTPHRSAAELEHMGVDHRGRHVGVAQQVLDRADVIAVLQQVGCKGMTQGMRGRRLGNAGGHDRALERPLESLVIQMMAPHHASARIGRMCRLRKDPEPRS